VIWKIRRQKLSKEWVFQNRNRSLDSSWWTLLLLRTQETGRLDIESSNNIWRDPTFGDSQKRLSSKKSHSRGEFPKSKFKRVNSSQGLWNTVAFNGHLRMKFELSPLFNSYRINYFWLYTVRFEMLELKVIWDFEFNEPRSNSRIVWLSAPTVFRKLKSFFRLVC
jgi:hypothetical protein